MNTKILFVDDEENILLAYARSLRKRFQMDLAPGGREALYRLKNEGPFAVIITDMRMPGMDGLQVIQAVRDYCREKMKHSIPEIMLTAYNDDRVKESALRLGVKEFLLKPFKVEEFLKVLEHNLGC